MPTEGFVRSSLVTGFINPNASSPKIDLYLGIVRWQRICQILISVQLRCVWRESIHLEYPKSASDQPLQQLLFWFNCQWLEIIFPSLPSVPSCNTWPEIKIYLILIPKSLDVRRLIGGKECILKPRTFVLWTPHKEHTDSAIRKDHLAPCRF